MRNSTLLYRGVLLWIAYGSKSLGEIFFKMLLRKKYCGFAVYLQIKSLTKIIDQNALEFLALWRDLLGIALQARIFGAVRAENKSKNLFFAESWQK